MVKIFKAYVVSIRIHDIAGFCGTKLFSLQFMSGWSEMLSIKKQLNPNIRYMNAVSSVGK